MLQDINGIEDVYRITAGLSQTGRERVSISRGGQGNLAVGIGGKDGDRTVGLGHRDLDPGNRSVTASVGESEHRMGVGRWV